MENLEKAEKIATIIAIGSFGLLMLSCIRPINGIVKVQKADILHKEADAYRLASLARKYEASVAGEQIKKLKNSIK